MSELPQKKVDESWKERVEQEKLRSDRQAAAAGVRTGEVASRQPAQAEGRPTGAAEELPEARFDLFISGLAMDAVIALGDMPHPVTKKQASNLPHARYLIDVLGILEEKTRGNLSVEEERLMKDLLYQLRMRYMAKAGG